MAGSFCSCRLLCLYNESISALLAIAQINMSVGLRRLFMSVLLCSNRKQVIERWKSLLADEEMYEAYSLEHLHSLCVQFKAAVLLLDVNLVDWDQLRKVCQQEVATKILLFSDRPSIKQGTAGIVCGCVGYGNTYMAKPQLEMAIETVRQGKVWLGRNLKQYLLKEQ
jgi:DNA-binding NarL/FixJ family response regulator